MISSRITALFLLIAALYLASPVLVPLVLALFISILLDPAVQELEDRGLPRSIGGGLAVALFCIGAVVTVWLAYRCLTPLIVELPTYSLRIHQLADGLRGWSQAHGYAPDWGNALHSPTWSPVVLHGVNSLSALLALSLFVPLMSAYLLVDKSNLKESLNTILGKYLFIPHLDVELSRATRAFFLGNLVGGLLLSLIQAGILRALGFQNALEIGFVSGFLNVVPLVGMPLAVLLPFAQGLLQFQTFLPFVAVGAAWLVLHFLMGNVVLPKLIGSRVNVNSAALLLGLLFWGWLWGFAGFLLAIPLTALVKVLLESNVGTRHIANLLTKRPRLIRR